MSRNNILLFAILSLAIFLRVFQFGQNPPALYWEEVALGYDAYSLLQTGKDHHGNFLPIVALESFGDWKPALYAYAIIPFIPIFGLSEIAVRLPSLLAGLSIVLASYFLAKKLGQSALLAMTVAAIAPWAIHFSRAGWESHLSAAFILWGIYCAMRSVGERINIRWAAASVILFGASLYTYHAARVTVPLLGVGIIFYIFAKARVGGSLQKFFKKNVCYLALISFLVVVFLVPFLQNLKSPALLQRGKETSIFTDISIIEESNALRENAQYSLASRLLYHRYVLFGKEILKNFSTHFNLDFLFISGDSQPRHSPQFFGHLYHIEFIFIIFGLVAWYKKQSTEKLLLLFWLLISILPGSITYGYPHALRMLAGFPVYIFIIAAGIEYLYFQWKKWLKPKYKKAVPLFAVAIIIAYGLELTAFWRHYTKIYPVVYAAEWQAGYKEMIGDLHVAMAKHPELPVYVSREMGRPAMYYWFYTQTDPSVVQAANATAKKDQGEFLEFGNISFVRGMSLDENSAPLGGVGIYANVIDGGWKMEIR